MTAGEGSGSWPLTVFGSIIYRSQKMTDCTKSAALASFLYWTQASATSQRIARRQGFVLASSDAGLTQSFLLQLRAFTCAGAPVSSLYNCITPEGELCSGAGSCVNSTCLCVGGRTGQYCQEGTSSGGSSAVTLAVALGVALPVMACIVFAIVAALVAWRWSHTRTGLNNWEIEYSEIEMGVQLGTGGYGAVHRAVWRGTEVAVVHGLIFLALLLTHSSLSISFYLRPGCRFLDWSTSRSHMIFP